MKITVVRMKSGGNLGEFAGEIRVFDLGNLKENYGGLRRERECPIFLASQL